MWGGSDQRARAIDNDGKYGGGHDWRHGNGGDGNVGRTRGSTTSSGIAGSRGTQTIGGSGGLGDNLTPSPGQKTPPPPAVTPIQSTLTRSSTSLNASSAGGPSYKSPFRGQLPTSSTPQFTASVRYTTDPSSTETVSIGVPPNGTSSTLSTKSSSNAGVIAGAVIFILFLFAIVVLLLRRRRNRRRNRIAPSAQYLAEYGSRPLSQWGRAFFSRRGSSQIYDIPHRHIWQGTNSHRGNQSLSEQTTRSHTDEPDMRESQSQTGHSNMRGSLSISGKTSIGAAAGHSPVPDYPFPDDPGAQTSNVWGR